MCPVCFNIQQNSVSLSLFFSNSSIHRLMNSFIKVDVLSLLGLSFDKSRVLYIRWFWTSFFEQVVFALGLLVIPSASDVSPGVKRHSRHQISFVLQNLSYSISESHARQTHPYDATPTRSTTWSPQALNAPYPPQPLLDRLFFFFFFFFCALPERELLLPSIVLRSLVREDVFFFLCRKKSRSLTFSPLFLCSLFFSTH